MLVTDGFDMRIIKRYGTYYLSNDDDKNKRIKIFQNNKKPAAE